MKKTILLIVILLSSIAIFGQQNIIPNPSFEEYECIPEFYQDFHCVKDWFAPDPYDNNPDYCHALATDFGSVLGHDGASVPNNWLDSQPSMDGDAYALLPIGYNRIREYISVKLIEPLEEGQEYQFSFYADYAQDIFGKNKFSNSIRRHFNGILEHIRSKLTNGVLEGINSKIQTLKRIAKGFRYIDNFKKMVFFIFDVIQPRIPKTT